MCANSILTLDQPFFDEGSADFDGIRIVDAQHLYRRASNRGAANAGRYYRFRFFDARGVVPKPIVATLKEENHAPEPARSFFQAEAPRCQRLTLADYSQGIPELLQKAGNRVRTPALPASKA
jgi:hypothetical protein